MPAYPFDLEGASGSYIGHGKDSSQPQLSPAFTLKPGLLVAEVRYSGNQTFKLEFVPTEGVDRAKTASVALRNIRSAGSILATATALATGPLAGGLLTKGTDLLANKASKGTADRLISATAEGRGPIETFRMVRVKDGKKRTLKPGKYRLAVESWSQWECNFIQPSLGQSEKLAGEGEGKSLIGWTEQRRRVLGPMKFGKGPTLAEVRHLGGGTFFAAALSLDGTHQCVIHEQEGQFHIGDIQTRIMPGKEYMFLVAAEGSWNMYFREGY